MKKLQKTETIVLRADGIGQVQAQFEGETVRIEGYGQSIPLDMKEAWRLAGWMQQHSATFYDLTYNYYECRECGQQHHKRNDICPLLFPKELL